MCSIPTATRCERSNNGRERAPWIHDGPPCLATREAVVMSAK